VLGPTNISSSWQISKTLDCRALCARRTSLNSQGPPMRQTAAQPAADSMVATSRPPRCRLAQAPCLGPVAARPRARPAPPHRHRAAGPARGGQDRPHVTGAPPPLPRAPVWCAALFFTYRSAFSGGHDETGSLPSCSRARDSSRPLAVRRGSKVTAADLHLHSINWILCQNRLLLRYTASDSPNGLHR
jgi:hypothetical protein